MASFQIPQDQPISKLELHLSCQNLVNLDTFSKSDPQVVISVLDQAGKWIEYARTEMINDNLNPKFLKIIPIDYRFEEIQWIKFAVYDIDTPAAPLDKQDFIGEIQCKLADIVTSKGSTIVRELKLSQTNPSKRGTITIHAEEIKDFSKQIKLQFQGQHLDKKDWFGKSDPYLIIHKHLDGNSYAPVFKSEILKNTLDPTWKVFTIGLHTLCSGDQDKQLMIECWDWNKSSEHEIIGMFKTTVREILSGKKEFELINSKIQQKKKGSYKNSGVIRVVQSELINNYTFVDYLQGGCEVSLIVAIDFTASNGNPALPNSLHYNNPYAPNEYVKAILSAGSILADYDYDRNFPVYGFGAKLPPAWQVSHCFPLNGNWQNPEVHEVNGILDVYQRTLNSVQLYGPTIFATVIKTAAQIASSFTSQQNQKYFILLIITDGVINDMEATIDEIVAACDLPLSIVIVGVGNADFQNMEILDADDNPLRASNGKIAKRDIVQFVPMRNYQNASIAQLSKAILEEIPNQLLGYMKAKGYQPNNTNNRPDKQYHDSFYNPVGQPSAPPQPAPVPVQQPVVVQGQMPPPQGYPAPQPPYPQHGQPYPYPAAPPPSYAQAQGQAPPPYNAPPPQGFVPQYAPQQGQPIPQPQFTAAPSAPP